MNLKTVCIHKATANVPLSAPTAAFVSGVRVKAGDRMLVVGQTAPAQNGIYVAGETGSNFVDEEEVFTLNVYVVLNLTAGAVYQWTKGVAAVELRNGTETLTQSGWFVAQGTTVTIEGEDTDPVDDIVKAAIWTRATDADDAADWSTSWGVLFGTELWWWERPAGFALGSDAVTISLITPTTAARVGSSQKTACVASATTNVVIASTGVGATIGSRTLVLNDRVLLTGQSTASQNGIYVVGSGSLSRATDADSDADWDRSWKVSDGTLLWSWERPSTFVLGTTAATIRRITPIAADF